MNGIHGTIQISVSILIALNVQKVSLNDVFTIICQFKWLSYWIEIVYEQPL